MQAAVYYASETQQILHTADTKILCRAAKILMSFKAHQWRMLTLLVGHSFMVQRWR